MSLRFTRPVIVSLALAFLSSAANAYAVPPPAGVTVTAPTLIRTGGTTFLVSINLSDPGNAGVGSYQFGLDYDPTVINPSGANAGCSNSGTLAGAANQGVTCNAVTTADPHVSTLLVSDFGSTATAGSSPPPLLNITFQATNTGPFPKTSQLHFHDAFFYTLTSPLAATMVDGSVQINNTTAANVTVMGRVTNSNGTPVRGASVTIAGANATTLTAVTNGFGYYRFASVPTGAAYTATANARGLSFAAKVIDLTDAVSNLNFTAQ